MNILERILADKRREIAARKSVEPLAAIERRAADSPRPPDFVAALASKPVGLIAEVKRRSPSAGTIREPFDPESIASAYEQGGAQAISVLMDSAYFGGGESDFMAVRSAVNLPLLYKEFVVDDWQVYHARAIGASAVLLIAAALAEPELKRLHDLAIGVGLTPLVEVHDRAEMDIAAGIGARCIGINNRDLRTFRTTLETTELLAPRAPRDCLLVSESGIHASADVARVRAAGARAVLVGESLLRQADLVLAVRALMEPAWASA